MHLGEQRETAQRHPLELVEAFDKPGLPKRPRHVERLRHQLVDQLEELFARAGPWQRGGPDVVFEFEGVVVDPVRIVEVHRHPDKLLAKAARQRDAPAIELEDVGKGDLLRGAGGIEQENHADVLGVALGPLRHHEDGVGHRQLSHRSLLADDQAAARSVLHLHADRPGLKGCCGPPCHSSPPRWQRAWMGRSRCDRAGTVRADGLRSDGIGEQDGTGTHTRRYETSASQAQTAPQVGVGFEGGSRQADFGETIRCNPENGRARCKICGEGKGAESSGEGTRKPRSGRQGYEIRSEGSDTEASREGARDVRLQMAVRSDGRARSLRQSRRELR